MDWTLLLTVLAPIVASLLTLLVSNQHSARANREEHSFLSGEEERKRIFAAKESRYRDRREAVVSFQEAIRQEEYAILGFEEDPSYGGSSPGDVYEDYDSYSLNTAFASVALLADDAVVEAAEKLQRALVNRYYGNKDSSLELKDAQRVYRDACRLMLGPAE
ncbi:hypothetical protein [Kocuria carniphila]|uniref:hypothetical protein n=1 Tax=Kocuria carniphila TaxID=262208 RepID=UPI00101B9943|nr:hypothetical protein [Kocuria carniphila]